MTVLNIVSRRIRLKALRFIFFPGVVASAFLITGLLKDVTGSAISALILVLGMLITLLATFGRHIG